jgi:spore cortex formation protein SpoVR/YcgB (stage V sporulation)
MCEINTSLGRFFELLKNHEPSSDSLNVSESKNCSILIISKIAKHWQFSSNNQRFSGRFFDFGNLMITVIFLRLGSLKILGIDI